MPPSQENSEETPASEALDSCVFMLIGGTLNGIGYEATTNPNLDSPEMYFTFGAIATIVAVHKWKKFGKLYEEDVARNR